MANELIAIVNFKQACAYIREGLQPVKVAYENSRMVFYFNIEDTKPIWAKWKNHEISI